MWTYLQSYFTQWRCWLSWAVSDSHLLKGPVQLKLWSCCLGKGQACGHEELNINVLEDERRIWQVMYAKNCEMTSSQYSLQLLLRMVQFFATACMPKYFKTSWYWKHRNKEGTIEWQQPCPATYKQRHSLAHAHTLLFTLCLHACTEGATIILAFTSLIMSPCLILRKNAAPSVT